MFLCADDTILYVKNPMKFTRQLIELRSKFTKIAGQKVNVDKLIVFLKTSNRQLANIINKKFYL